MKLLLMIFIFQTALLSAHTIDNLVPAEYRRNLMSDGHVTVVQIKNPEPALVPSSVLVRTKSVSIFDNLNPSILVETLYLYEKPVQNSGRSWNDKEYLALYNAVRSISTLSGIQYYSASRDEMRTFYELSTIINNPDAKEPLRDPVVFYVPHRDELYAQQKDLTFGDNIYRYEYLSSPEEILFIQENLTTMSYGIIPVLRQGRLRTIVSITDTDDYLLVYAASYAKASLLPGIENRLRNSFSNRTDAVFSWFKKKADSSFKSVTE